MELLWKEKRRKPVYLFLHNSQGEIKDARDLWGKTTKETQEAIKAELNDKAVRIASIGPGGENLVKFACIINDLKEAAGRGGTGAMMGSKNLKAIAVHGTQAPEAANPEVFTEMQRFFKENAKMYESNSTYGTGAPAMMASMVPHGQPPYPQLQGRRFPGREDRWRYLEKDCRHRDGRVLCLFSPL